MSNATAFDLCPVCYEKFPPRDLERGQLPDDLLRTCCAASNACEHALCHCCWKEYFVHCVSERLVPITCPVEGCDTVVPHEFVKTMLLSSTDEAELKQGNEAVNHKTWVRLERLVVMAADPLLVECSRCEELIRCCSAPDVECSKCSYRFCTLHGDTHAGSTCAEYERTKDGRRVKKSEKILNEWTKVCPHCGARIQKWTGCNIVQCSMCKGMMCYGCGEQVNANEHRCDHCTGGGGDGIFRSALIIILLIPVSALYCVYMCLIVIVYVSLLLVTGIASCFWPEATTIWWQKLNKSFANEIPLHPGYEEESEEEDNDDDEIGNIELGDVKHVGPLK